MKAKTTMTDGLLRFEVDQDVLKMIEKALGSMSSQSRKVLKNAVNATAKQARTDMVNKAKEEYTVKKKKLNENVTKKNATVSNPEATIMVKGKTLELREFKATAPKRGAKAQILSGGTLKLIQSKRGSRAKAFLATFSSGYQAIVQRQDGKTYTSDGRSKRAAKYGKYADMTQIKTLLSISAPKMIGDEKKVFGVIRPKIYENLAVNIQKEINKVVNSA